MPLLLLRRVIIILSPLDELIMSCVYTRAFLNYALFIIGIINITVLIAVYLSFIEVYFLRQGMICHCYWLEILQFMAD